MQALMLAAGMGRRLGKYTEQCTKCMVEVGGQTLLERAVESLKQAGIHRLIMVVGWESERLIQYIEENLTGMEFVFVQNPDYAITNNIHSLYLARSYLAEDDTILLESDLVFDPVLIEQMVNSPDKDLVAVAKYEQWMDGTVTTLSSDGLIREYIEKRDFKFENADRYYKTVNIYKFSRDFSVKQYIPFLEAYIAAYGKNQYYEMVLQMLAHHPDVRMKAFDVGDLPWYEIDDAQDLDIANILFAPEEDMLSHYEHHYGGYWRFTGLRDFCYLVNPYFPTRKMMDQMKYFFETLLTQYPSGMNTQKQLASQMFGVKPSYLLVGNGAAELINILGKTVCGTLAVPTPSFNEYIRCFKRCKIRELSTVKNNFQLDREQLLKAVDQTDCLAIINPDNPSGSFLPYSELKEILDACLAKGVRCIVDESFIDFAQRDLRYTLLDDEFLEAYPNLVVIKSISKSYGVPGLRLGVLATSDQRLLDELREELPIWNINSFAEYFLQIFSHYSDHYWSACDEIALQREKLIHELESIRNLQVYPSQANYVMCKVNGPISSRKLAADLLLHHRLLIKDLSTKHGFFGQQFIRLAVRDEADNKALVEALREEFESYKKNG